MAARHEIRWVSIESNHGVWAPSCETESKFSANEETTSLLVCIILACSVHITDSLWECTLQRFCCIWPIVQRLRKLWKPCRTFGPALLEYSRTEWKSAWPKKSVLFVGQQKCPTHLVQHPDKSVRPALSMSGRSGYFGTSEWYEICERDRQWARDQLHKIRRSRNWRKPDEMK